MKKTTKHIEVRGVIRVLTGLRIGAGSDSLEIGGLDNPIIRHPQTRKPYLPGSSLKGKLRCLLESKSTSEKYGQERTPEPSKDQDRNTKKISYNPCKCDKCIVCQLFGCGAPQNTTQPSRLIFRDSPICEDDIKGMEDLLKEGIFYSEIKSEVTMDRQKGTAAGAGPRSMDRIMAGTGLDFNLTVRILEGDQEDQMKKALFDAFRMLEKEGLGGSVTRGYGQVKFENLTWDDRTEPLYNK